MTAARGALVDRRHGAQPGHDGIEVGRLHLGVERKAHRRLELAVVTRHAGGDGALDLVVAPVAETLGLARRDVARHRDAEPALELEAAGAGPREVAALRAHRGVAL